MCASVRKKAEKVSGKRGSTFKRRDKRVKGEGTSFWPQCEENQEGGPSKLHASKDRALERWCGELFCRDPRLQTGSTSHLANGGGVITSGREDGFSELTLQPLCGLKNSRPATEEGVKEAIPHAGLLMRACY